MLQQPDRVCCLAAAPSTVSFFFPSPFFARGERSQLSFFRDERTMRDVHLVNSHSHICSVCVCVCVCVWTLKRRFQCEIATPAEASSLLQVLGVGSGIGWSAWRRLSPLGLVFWDAGSSEGNAMVFAALVTSERRPLPGAWPHLLRVWSFPPDR